jgi:methanogenic corrinoid protein MtbC1
MSHHHDHHGHHHHEKHEHTGNDDTPDFKTKLKMLFEHWQTHNDNHIESYESWAKKAEDQGLEATAVILKEIAQATKEISDKIKKASESVR